MSPRVIERRFVPLAKLKSTVPTNVYRVDLHLRLSRDRRIVCIDATHEGMGRQMYVLEIGHVLDYPPGHAGNVHVIEETLARETPQAHERGN